MRSALPAASTAPASAPRTRRSRLHPTPPSTQRSTLPRRCPPFDIENPTECLANPKENTLYVVAETGAGGYPFNGDSPNPALAKVMKVWIGVPAFIPAERIVDFSIEPSGFKYGGTKEYLFSLRNLGVALQVGTVYEDAVESSDSKSPNPILEVFGICPLGSYPTGRFIFHELAYEAVPTSLPNDRPASRSPSSDVAVRSNPRCAAASTTTRRTREPAGRNHTHRRCARRVREPRGARRAALRRSLCPARDGRLRVLRRSDRHPALHGRRDVGALRVHRRGSRKRAVSPSIDAGGPLPSLPFGLDDPSRCLIGGSRLYVFSQSRNRPDWEVIGIDPYSISPQNQRKDSIRLFLKNQGAYNVSFDTSRLAEPIQAKRYDAVECGIGTYMKPATYLWGYSCWPEHVTVVVHEIVWQGDTLDRLTMNFEFEEPYRAGKTVACFHYER